MSDEATNILSKAIGAKIAARGQAPAKAETDETEEKHSHSYSMACPACNAAIQFADEDLEQWRTDESAGSTDGDDDSEPDEDEDEDGDYENKKSALVASIIKAAKTNQK